MRQYVFRVLSGSMVSFAPCWCIIPDVVSYYDWPKSDIFDADDFPTNDMELIAYHINMLAE